MYIRKESHEEYDFSGSLPYSSVQPLPSGSAVIQVALIDSKK